jgi:hypothetical protein
MTSHILLLACMVVPFAKHNPFPMKRRNKEDTSVNNNLVAKCFGNLANAHDITTPDL